MIIDQRYVDIYNNILSKAQQSRSVNISAFGGFTASLLTSVVSCQVGAGHSCHFVQSVVDQREMQRATWVIQATMATDAEHRPSELSRSKKASLGVFAFRDFIAFLSTLGVSCLPSFEVLNTSEGDAVSHLCQSSNDAGIWAVPFQPELSPSLTQRWY